MARRPTAPLRAGCCCRPSRPVSSKGSGSLELVRRSVQGVGLRNAPSLLHVALVVFLGAVEPRCADDLRDDPPSPRLLLVGERGCRSGLLLGVVEEDGRPVLIAEVEALAVSCGGVVDTPERLEKLGVADHGGIEPHLDRFGMSGAV